MLTKTEVLRNDDIKVLEVAGTVDDGDLAAWKQALYAPFTESWGPLMLQANALTALCPAGLAELGGLAQTLDAQGVLLIVASERPELFPGLHVMENRHLALGEILNKRGVRDEVQKFIDAAMYVSLLPLAAETAEPEPVRFMQNLGFLLLFTYENPPQIVPVPGDRLHFHVGLNPEEADEDAAFDTTVKRFAYLKDGVTACVVVPVPDVVSRADRPRETDGIEIDLNVTFQDPQAIRGAPKYARLTALSTTSATMRATYIDQRVGEIIALEIDFRTFKLSQPLKAEIVSIEPMAGEFEVRLELDQRMPGYDLQRLETYLEDLVR